MCRLQIIRILCQQTSEKLYGWNVYRYGVQGRRKPFQHPRRDPLSAPPRALMTSFFFNLFNPPWQDLFAKLTFSLHQRFPNFFWSRTICGPKIFTVYHLENALFQENSFYPISFDQKFGKPDLTQMRHEQNVRNHNDHFSKLIREVHKNAGIS